MVTDQIADFLCNYFQMKENEDHFNLNLHNVEGRINTGKHALIC